MKNRKEPQTENIDQGAEILGDSPSAEEVAEEIAKAYNHHFSFVTDNKPLITPGEALFSFVNWLFTRDQIVIMSRKHPPQLAFLLAKKFLDENNLPSPSENDWASKVKLPKS